MEEIIQKIISDNNFLWPDKCTANKINVGFTNTVYNINDKYIIKICTKKENEEAFTKEVAFYNKSANNPHIPKLLKADISKTSINYMYEILEKIEGKSLYLVWPNLEENKREDVIKQLCEILKEFHQVKGDAYNFSGENKNKSQKYLQKIANSKLTSKERALISSAISKFDDYLKSSEFVLIHNDIHFDNIIYHKGKIKIIDFERSMVAPVDKELDIFFRMVDMPYKYASEEAEKYVKIADYKNIKAYVKKYYPTLVDQPFLEKRLAIYDLIDFLKAYSLCPDEEKLKEIALNKAKYIISKVSV